MATKVKIEVTILSIDYVDVKPTLTSVETHTIVTGLVHNKFITVEIDRKVEAKDELLAEIMKEYRKPRSPFEGQSFEVKA